MQVLRCATAVTPCRRFPAVNEFKPGLEGVVAFETRDRGARPGRRRAPLSRRRHRGARRPRTPTSRSGACSSTRASSRACPSRSRTSRSTRAATRPPTSRPRRRGSPASGRCGKLVDISAEQARDDLGPALGPDDRDRRRRRPASPTGTDRCPSESSRRARTRPRSSCSAGAARPIRSTSRRSTPTGSARPSTGSTPRPSPRASSPRRARTAARRMSAAVGALSGPLHGGAPARVLPMLDEVARTRDPEGYVQSLLDAAERIMGFGHRVYRAEDPRARLLRRTAQELGSPRFEVAEELERAALAALREYKPDRPLETNVEFWSAVVLDVADIPPTLTPAMFACSRVAGWSAHILEEKRTGRLIRPSAHYVGPAAPARRRPSVVEPRRGRRRRRTLSPRAGNERELAELRAEWAEELEAAARSQDYRERAVAYRAVGQFRFRAEDRAAAPRARGREPGLPRLGAALARAALARPPAARSTRVRPLLHDARRTRTTTRPCDGWRSCALRNGSASARHDRAPTGHRRGGRAATATSAQTAAKVAAGLRRRRAKR